MPGTMPPFQGALSELLLELAQPNRKQAPPLLGFSQLGCCA